MRSSPGHAGAEEYLPGGRDIDRLAAAAQACRGCDLFERATQAVFGDGPPDARVLLVGEQPGDVEDRAGRPFVGPAGKLLRRALADAGMDPESLYFTNAVKHFRWRATSAGKRRIHQKPSTGQVSACRPWLRAEVEAVAPGLIVALGATAAQSLMGSGFRLTQSRGVFFDWPPASVTEFGAPDPPPRLLATVHPSAVLRAPARDEALDQFVADLRLAAQWHG